MSAGMSTTRKVGLLSGTPGTDSTTERELLKKFEKSPVGERHDVLSRLGHFHRHQADRDDLANTVLDLMAEEQASQEQRAVLHLELGQKAQAAGAWHTALEQYALALSRSPQESRTLYLLYSNCAHCWNKLAFYSEAAHYSRLAIATDPKRHDAYNTLGISLKSQGDLAGAAWCFVEAIRVNPSDRHANQLLRELVIDYPMLTVQSPWIEAELELLERG
jgi:tetratricopeptide (TPR) repeat protein